MADIETGGWQPIETAPRDGDDLTMEKASRNDRSGRLGQMLGNAAGFFPLGILRNIIHSPDHGAR